MVLLMDWITDELMSVLLLSILNGKWNLIEHSLVKIKLFEDWLETPV